MAGQAIARSVPEQAGLLLTCHHHSAKMMLRMHHATRASYLDNLHQQGISAHKHPYVDSAIVLGNSLPVSQLPEFDTGQITIQDAHAQLAATLLDVQDGQSVLDACAAPGGKTAHLAVQASDLSITALDSSAARLKKLQQTLSRLSVDAEVIEARLEDFANHHPERCFERILLDAPCSATGIIRRHPDLLYLRNQDSVELLNQTQATLLKAAWSLLKPHGKLLYVTCSLLESENHQQISQFLEQTADARLIPLQHPHCVLSGDMAAGMLQFLPSESGDGFFYALLEKKA